MLQKELTANTRFGYADDIVILRINLITFYIITALAINVNNILN